MSIAAWGYNDVVEALGFDLAPEAAACALAEAA